MAYIDKALSWSTIKAEDGEGLNAFAPCFTSSDNAMSDLDYMEELDNVNCGAIVGKLPYKLKEKWRGVVFDIQEQTSRRLKFKDLVRFINMQAKVTTWYWGRGHRQYPCHGSGTSEGEERQQGCYFICFFDLDLFGKQKTVRSHILKDLGVCGLEGCNFRELQEVCSQKTIPANKGNIPQQEDLSRWLHLEQVKIPHIDAEIGLLIGTNLPKAMEPDKVIRSVNNGPYSVRTVLGWAVNEPLRDKNCEPAGNGKCKLYLYSAFQQKKEIQPKGLYRIKKE